jgi:two-component system, NarL family, nitrate/nitrite response regulator NarL
MPRREVITVVVAEDHPIYRQGLVEAIAESDGLEVLGQTADGVEALRQIRKLDPDVALVDLTLPRLDGIHVLRSISRERLPTRVLILSAYLDGALVYEALEAGAAGYLSKHATAAEVREAIAVAVAGETVLSPGLDRVLARQIAPAPGRASSALQAGARDPRAHGAGPLERGGRQAAPSQ